ncbi:sulfite exporter TauE/SafE family protein [Candidatus Bathyarchaeota archaeon]|nr:sulfite exporter TauE/SafE family protein [Candidatus Bathyarchaeota archaeon]
MPEVNWLQWLIAVITAFSIGLTKTGIPGLSVLFIPLMAEVFPARASTGIVLPMLMFADIFAVAYYRKHAVWPQLFRLMPWTALGIVIGYLALGRVNDAQLKPIIGVIILIMLAINFLLGNRKEKAIMPGNHWFAAVMGVAAGITTMMANVAGTIVSIYFLAMKLPKNEFIGTGSWFFLILNWFKLPFSMNLGLININSLQLDIIIFPAVALGALVGIVSLKRIPEKKFTVIVQLLAAIAAASLLIQGCL